MVICRSKKPKARKGKVLFINAVNEVTRERAQSFLTDPHIERVVKAYRDFATEPGFAHVAPLEEMRGKAGSLNIALYVVGNILPDSPGDGEIQTDLGSVLHNWMDKRTALKAALEPILSAAP